MTFQVKRGLAPSDHVNDQLNDCMRPRYGKADLQGCKSQAWQIEFGRAGQAKSFKKACLGRSGP